MKRTLSSCVIAGLVCWGFLAGCDVPPAPPEATSGGVAKCLFVAAGAAAELEAVTAMEAARVNYDYRLQVLRQRYQRVGNMDKYVWTERELKNLHDAKTFQWSGVPEIVPPKGETVETDERLLVEYVVEARSAYLKAVEDLARFYEQMDPASYKAKRIRNMQDRFDPVRTYLYFLTAEIPPSDRKPVEMIPAAEKLFQDAYALYRGGKVLPGVTDYPKERLALMKFLELVREYPNSTKIALSAYYIGEIYKEYFNEDLRAVQWYERAWQWDPNLTEPARFQAGTVYDLRLQNKARAVRCYRMAIEHEQFNSSNMYFARQRIGALTGVDPQAARLKEPEKK